MKKIIMFLMLFLLFSLGVSVNAVQINDSDITLLSNTGQCLTDCETWLEWDFTTAQASLQAPTVKNLSWSVDFVKKNLGTPDLLDWGVEIWEEKSIKVIDYCPQTQYFDKPRTDLNASAPTCASLGCTYKNIISCSCPNTVSVSCGSHFIQEWQKQADSIYNFRFDKGKIYRLRVWGKKQARLGENNIDWIPTFDGVKIGKWAWWNSTWTMKSPIVLPNEDVNLGNTIQIQIDFTSIDFSGNVMADLNDVRVIKDDTTEIDRFCDGSSTTSDANCFFRIVQDIAIDSPDLNAYYLYYNNPSAGNPPKDDVARGNVDGFEDGDFLPGFTCGGCPMDTGIKRFGANSVKLVGANLETVAADWEDLGSKGDFNYSWWFYGSPSTGSALTYITQGGSTIVAIEVTTSTFKYHDGSWKNVGTAADNTWYNMQVHYINDDDFWDFAVYNEAGEYVTGAGYLETRTVSGTPSKIGHYATGTFYYDNVYFKRPLEALGVGAQLEFSTPPYMTSIDLNITYAKQNDHILVQASDVNDAEANNVSLFCGTAPNPTVDTNNFCTAFQVASPYSDVNCTGLGAAGDGLQTIYCRLWDADYSIDQNIDTYTADNTPPSIDYVYPVVNQDTTTPPITFLVKLNEAGTCNYGIFLQGSLDTNGSKDTNASFICVINYLGFVEYDDFAFLITNQVEDSLGNSQADIQQTATYTYITSPGTIDPKNLEDDDLTSAGFWIIYQAFAGLAIFFIPFFGILIVGGILIVVFRAVR